MGRGAMVYAQYDFCMCRYQVTANLSGRHADLQIKRQDLRTLRQSVHATWICMCMRIDNTIFLTFAHAKRMSPGCARCARSFLKTHTYTHKTNTDSGAANRSIQNIFVGNMHDVGSGVFAFMKLLYEFLCKVALNPFDRNLIQPLDD